MKERCRDGCRTSLLIAGVVLVPAIFHTSLPPCHPYITIHFMEMSRCTTCSANSGDWRLKHLPWEEGNTYSSGPAQAKERETHLAQGQLSNQGLKHQRWGKDVLSTSDSANSVSTDKHYKSNKCTANAVFNFHLKAISYLWTVVYSDLIFNIIIMYCLSHNLLCSFTINSLHKKKPP